MTDYDNYGTSSGSSNSEDGVDYEIKFTKYVTIESRISSAVATDSQYGQSFGVFFEALNLVDGLAALDTDKDLIKIFSWEEVTGFPIEEWYNRNDGEINILELADEIITRNYPSGTKTYEVIAARFPGNEEVGYDPQSISREGVGSTLPDREDFEDLELGDGNYVLLPDCVNWFNGGDDPSVSALVAARTLGENGDNGVNDNEDIYNWLNYGGGNVLRDDVENRRVRTLFTTEESENGYTYKFPVFLTEDGNRIQPDNTVPSGKTEDPSSDNDVPSPVADFVDEAGNNIALDEDRANRLLDDLVAGDGPMTEELIEEAGGRDRVISMVV